MSIISNIIHLSPTMTQSSTVLPDALQTSRLTSDCPVTTIDQSYEAKKPKIIEDESVFSFSFVLVSSWRRDNDADVC